MAFDCPFCAQSNADHALVCNSCCHDITVPASLLAERDDLVRKLATVKDELARAKAELDSYKGKGMRLLAAGR